MRCLTLSCKFRASSPAGRLQWPLGPSSADDRDLHEGMLEAMLEGTLEGTVALELLLSSACIGKQEIINRYFFELQIVGQDMELPHAKNT